MIMLDYKPRPWQQQCHLARKRFSVLALHRRAGKTELAIMELLDCALRHSGNLGFFVYIAPFLKQGKQIAWARLKQKLNPLRGTPAAEINESELTVTFLHNGATIRIFGGDNPDALRGVGLDGCVLDEVAQIKPEVWTDIVQPALSDRKGWAMFIGTPAGINLFSELFYKATSGDRPEWWGARYTVYDTDSLDHAEVQRLKADMPEPAFAREYLCDFSAAGDDQLIGLTDVQLSASRVYTAKDTLDMPKVLGVDPARFGDDRSVIIRRQGVQAFDPYVFRGLDNMELAARIAKVIDDWDPDAVFVDSGAGAGVIDRLRQLGYDILEVAFGGKPANPNLFINKRTEMWWLMREWVQQGGAIPNDQALKLELSTPIYWYDSNGRRVLESKDEIKKRLQGGASPDIADALALTFAMPIGKQLPREIRQVIKPQREEYNPYSRMNT